jgi:cytochrome c
MQRCLEIAALSLLGMILLSACSWGYAPRTTSTLVPGGDPQAGQRAIVQHGCASCHVIPGIYGPESHVGPPLTSFARRSFIGGVAPNTTDNLILWIQSPQAINRYTAMPATTLSEQEARDIAAYLYTLDRDTRQFRIGD